MLKKWRPFWSYDIEKTERWLSEMAADGKQLSYVNMLTRVFSFEDASQKKAEYQIVYDKSKSPLQRVFEKSGWHTRLRIGNWMFIENTKDVIRTYPQREGILKRNKIHVNVATGIAFLSGAQVLLMVLVLSIILSSGEPFERVGIFGLVVALNLLQSIVMITLTVYARRKLSAFEFKHFNAQVEDTQPTQGTFSVWKLGWKEEPDLIENWLAEMSEEGNHFISIGKQNGKFNFQKGEPKHVSYVCDFQLKASPSYYDVHKNAGWKLKYTSPLSMLKQSVWLKEYSKDEERPRFTYDQSEEKKRVRNVIIGNALSTFYPVTLTLILLWFLIPFYMEVGWTLFIKILVGGIILSLIIPVKLIIRIIKYALRMRQFD